MKRIAILFSLLLIISINASAQTGARFGFKGGYSLALQYGEPAPDDSFIVETSGRNGFAGGVFVYFPLTDAVGIQQEFIYAMKGSGQDVTITTPVDINTVSTYKINYFEMPIVLKYKFVNIKSVGVYGSTGIALSFLLNGEYDITSTINAGGPPVIAKEEGDMKTVDTFDYSFVYGTGADFKMLNKDFFFEYRMTIGWNVLNMPNVTGADPVPLRNQDYLFALGMYF